MFSKKIIFSLSLTVFALFSGCSKNKPSEFSVETVSPFYVKFKIVSAKMPERFRTEVVITDKDIPAFVAELEEVIADDTEDLLRFCSKQVYLPSDYEPSDLVRLTKNPDYRINRNDLSLRKVAYENLAVMARAAKSDGIILDCSSSYRSYSYQVGLYNRNVVELGRDTADRESARPGASQHQLGVVIDFGSVTDEFAETPAGKWLDLNAANYGWSLSFPIGYEDITGYRWECWHFRYVGLPAIKLQKKWFNNIQHYMLEFIYHWKNS